MVLLFVLSLGKRLMKPCLADVNVLLPLILLRHEHHQTAWNWFRGLQPGESGLCRIVQLAVVRLLGNRAVMGQEAVAAARGLRIIDELLEDQRMEFISEPVGVDAVLPRLLKYSAPTTKLITDAYLAAFAIASSRRFTTFDDGFEQFAGLEVELLISR